MAKIAVDDFAFDGGGTLGNATSDLVGLWGATASTQPSSSSQAAVTTLTISTVVVSFSASTASAFFLTNSTQITDLVSIINSLNTRLSAVTILANQLRTDLISVGAIKGS